MQDRHPLIGGRENSLGVVKFVASQPMQGDDDDTDEFLFFDSAEEFRFGSGAPLGTFVRA